MAGLEIKCPFCGGKCSVRTSERPTLLSIRATVYCRSCGTLKADFIGQLTNVKRALFLDCPQAERWSKTEKEQIKEDGKKPLSNEERLRQFRAGKDQPDLFESDSEPQKPLTPAERVELRKSVQH